MTARQLSLRVCQLVVSLTLLTYLIATVPMRDVLGSVLSAKPLWLAGGFALVGVTNLLAALQMRAILAAQGVTFSLRQIAGINLITTFYGFFLPSYLAGGVIRWHHFSRPEGKRAQALAAMIFSREVELVTTLGYGIVFYYLASSSASVGSAIIAPMTALAAAVLIVALSVHSTSHAAFHAALRLLSVPHGVMDRVSKVSACLVNFGTRGRGHLLQFLGLCICRNAIGVAAFVFFARALFITTPAMDLGWIRSALDLVLILPISIAGLGLRDASLVTMLNHLSVPAALALAFSFVLLGRTVLVALLGGLVEGWRVYYGVAPGLVKTQLKT